MTTKKVLVILAEGLEEGEAIIPIDILKRGGISVTTAALSNKEVTGAHDITLIADKLLYQCSSTEFDAIFLPGGMPGTLNLLKSDEVLEISKEFLNSGKICAAICAAPRVLEKIGALKSQNYTAYPGTEEFIKSGNNSGKDVEISGNIITGRGLGVSIEFALTLVEQIVDRETALQIAEKTVFPYTFNEKKRG